MEEIIDFSKESLLLAFDKINLLKRSDDDVSTVFGFKKMGDKTISIYSALYVK